MTSKFKNILLIIAIFSWIILMLPASPRASSENSATTQEDTMLMFVGEDLEVLSIASRRQESAWQAPAVAQVITREELEERGTRTLSHALGMVPGFFMAQKEWGTQPYLRGIPDSVLFLYDTVPMVSDITKSLHPLDHELSLASVKRVEIVRGPGSVLWGADAFAGIVNVVPMTGKDLDGIETGILYGGPGDQGSVYLNMGHDAGPWDAFLSISGREGEEYDTTCNLVRFWGDGKTPFAPQDRFGEKKPDRSHYFEMSGNFSFRDWITLSGRLSDYKKPYAMSGPDGDLIWPESRSASNGFLKLEAKKALDRSSDIRLAGYYHYLNSEYEIIDLTLKPKECTSYGEIIYNRSFLSGRGLFTGGTSYREKHVKNAPIWESYLPDYLGTGNEKLLPGITKKEYHTSLWSLFGQYNHKIGDVDLWLGLRNDDHDEYQDHLSYNIGAAWSPWSQWMFKVLYGTAYRTPFASQLLEEGKPDLEKIKTLNAQIAWKPSKHAGLSLCGFASRIKNHTMEDPYAGLSSPNHQDIKGVEIEGHLSPVKYLDFSANLTLIDNSGPDETYHYNDYSYVRPDGTVVKHYTDLRYSYDSGADTLFNLTGTWRPIEKVSTFLRLNYFSSRQLIYPRSKTSCSCPAVWLLDISTTISDFIVPGVELGLSVKNLTDKHYETPGTYSTIHGSPISAEVVLRKRW